MNNPSRTDDTLCHPGWNQNPPPLNADATTRQDLNGIANSREQRDHALQPDTVGNISLRAEETEIGSNALNSPMLLSTLEAEPPGKRSRFQVLSGCILRELIKFSHFVGPGFLIAVAYIDPGNYATDVAAGAQSKYAMLFVVMLSNIFAVFLQSLCIKLGSVTGLNLAENCRIHLPRWMVIILYILSEAAIIATDIAEVIGSAIALNLLFKIPLVAGCAITLVDVLFLLIFYRPNGSMFGLRAFEMFVTALVLGVVVCFCIQLSLIKSQSVGEVLRGYLPSASVVRNGGSIYQSCGILGATIMPHSLFLGSGIVQPRLKHFDVLQGYVDSATAFQDDGKDPDYRPSIYAIRNCLKYSIIELTLALFTFAVFVNSAILIVAGAALFGTDGADNADLFGVHKLLSQSISPAAGTIFALALLLSGLSAGIICTIAGQMVSEGMIRWTLKPWLRRFITRAISIIPSIIIAGAVGETGLNAALTASQVVLSVILPFATAPLIYFTCRNRYMTVQTVIRDGDGDGDGDGEGDATATIDVVKMRNSWPVTVLALMIWLAITTLNVALLVFLGLGQT
ncbi:hypothetical protein Egran_05592 [Elaphomyces granulatus]|uniref:Uncharacterized protein n=1 Tax=Elaphomyces granulatus TaxID=519963 RepID=A0A232LR57_9EURO|nr:hypothetical protein Egran_05592 [Elaphomyces granulatus]